MPNHRAELKRFEKSITELSDALAHLGKGTSLRELILIIKRPGWTTPAELAFASSIVETMASQVASLERLQGDLLKGSQMVGLEARVGADVEETVAS
ncbi:MAG TPA: hypothetical protein VH394_03705 [Thermoanaerobaculia bacterium]|nr:hypothetical protein [Thermoanaerobaculia bacterium]